MAEIETIKKEMKMKIPQYRDTRPTRGPNLSPQVVSSGRGGSAGRPLAQGDVGLGVKPSPAGGGTAGSVPSDQNRPARAAAEKAAEKVGGANPSNDFRKAD